MTVVDLTASVLLNENFKINLLKEFEQVKVGVKNNSEYLNSSIEEINNTFDSILSKIQQCNDVMRKFYLVSTASSESIDKTINDVILKEFEDISRRLKLIESDSKVQIQLNNALRQQRKMFKLIYVVFTILLIILILQLKNYFLNFYK